MWDNMEAQKLIWEKEIPNKEEKLEVAKQMATNVRNGDVIGFGSGSTSYLTIQEIAKKVKQEKIQITAIPTSKEIEFLCQNLNIPVTSLIQANPDWSFDGADEVNKEGWLIKGRGAAMFREKLVMASSKKRYILIDKTKQVEKLGENFKVPIEVYPEAIQYVRKELKNIDAENIELRLAVKKDGPVITEQGNVILDTSFKKIEETLENKINMIPGVIENGLFIGYDVILVGI